MYSLDLHPRHRMEKLGVHGIHCCSRWTSHVSIMRNSLGIKLTIPRLYGVRRLLLVFYNYRISNSQEHLDGLYREKDATIEKLKQATKYDSTQQLLDKYGAGRSPTSKTESTKQNGAADAENHRRSSADRVFISPPPTANIQRHHSAARSSGATLMQEDSTEVVPDVAHSSASALDGPPRSGPETTAEFAPNAFDQSVQYIPPNAREPRWFDRLLDSVTNIIMGEDETLASQRLALICSHCRLINGLAPPGVRTLEEVGKWRCRECHGWNGEEFDSEKITKDNRTQKTLETTDEASKSLETDATVDSPDSAEAKVKEE
jgi:endoplasmic reticulum junction formation protein lunapark